MTLFTDSFRSRKSEVALKLEKCENIIDIFFLLFWFDVTFLLISCRLGPEGVPLQTKFYASKEATNKRWLINQKDVLHFFWGEISISLCILLCVNLISNNLGLGVTDVGL